MKTLTKMTLFGAAVSIGIHLYLAFHYYPVKFGFSSGPSICTINSTFDCDAATASSYSAVFDIPLALWGVAANLVIFIMVLSQWLGLSDHSERLRRFSLILIGSSVFASVVMAIISVTMLKNYCLFCITLYFISVAMFECYRRTLEEPFFANLWNDLNHLWEESRGVVTGFAAVPALAFGFHYVFMETYGIEHVSQLVGSSMTEWKVAPSVNFTVASSLSKGPADALMTIKEFADFRCGHCRHAVSSLENFVKTHPDVRMEFYNYPLDGECNEKLKPYPNGVSCRMAYAVHCAEKQNRGWDLHHAVYDHQDEFMEFKSPQGAEDKIVQMAKDLGLDTEALRTCVSDPQTKEAIRLQAKQGEQGQVQGTPTIFVNNKMLQGGQLIPVLEAVRELIKK